MFCSTNLNWATFGRDARSEARRPAMVESAKTSIAFTPQATCRASLDKRAARRETSRWL
jgi:hypothetical protein